AGFKTCNSTECATYAGSCASSRAVHRLAHRGRNRGAQRAYSNRVVHGYQAALLPYLLPCIDDGGPAVPFETHTVITYRSKGVHQNSTKRPCVLWTESRCP